MPKEDLSKLNEKQLRQLSGSRMRLARQRKNMFMREVREQMARRGIVWAFESRVAGYENGDNAMTAYTARMLGEILDVSPAWLLCVEDALPFDADTIDTVRRFNEAPPDVREMISKMLSMRSASLTPSPKGRQ
jgi:transcriptional regulator with XRE-family HTH domain